MTAAGRPYASAAAHYLRGRPPYSARLVDVVRDEIGLDGTGTLIDVGCGPGVVTFGQSLHWTDREPVLVTVHELLEPGGAVALIAPAIEHGSPPAVTSAPPIPHERIEALIGHYLAWSRGPREDIFERSLARSPFGECRVAYAPGRTDIVRTSDEVVSGYLSMSFAAPHRLGDRVDAFVADLHALLSEASPAGRFHDWPGDTVIVWATKRG